ncbi:L10-interacting MYB domain-containing protein [Lactuca sativa]|uniref:Myb/SANT-like domain-containing protein n=1 Tax=Lactuca sativa TaxID=4236 RepID=A0A9R1UKR4_LACSA|nr:L10-interacting MYB domain-containing protein [Lactuca sativa]XP_023741628.1 L10-interacting MYB domain-containing protein [Lactuca sativa]XP_042753990.1 L10-interacting MYB domain-containing protein [Lactuca sativa]KAJ0188651.1 hypothetical protein LSAT_V11C900455330 [Lactuca sativa]
MEKGMRQRQQRNSDGLRTIWTPEMDRYFIELMLEEAGKGNRIDDHLFSKRAWNHMTLLFNTKFRFQYEKDVLKNRHKTLRNVYKVINKLLALDGFSWDHTRQMVIAHNEVWDDYIKVHPGARSYRIKSIPYYYDLCEIYKKKISGIVDTSCGIIVVDEFMMDEEVEAGGSRTYWEPGMDGYLIELMVGQLQKGNQIDGLFLKQAWMEMINSFNHRFGFKYHLHTLKNRYKTFKRQYNTINKLLGSQGFLWDDLRQMVVADDHTWQDYIQTNPDARQYMTRPVPYYKDLCIVFVCKETLTTVSAADDQQESSHNSSVAVEHVIEAIQGLPDMDDDLILDACDFLEDDKKAKTFLSLDLRLRRKWLIRKLRPQPSTAT